MGWIILGVVVYLLIKLRKLVKHQAGVERVSAELKKRGYELDDLGRVIGKELSKEEEAILWGIYNN